MGTFLARAQQLQDQSWAQKDAPNQMSLAAHAQAIKGLQTKLADLPEGSPEYNATVDAIQQNIHAMREIVAPDQKLGPLDWLERHTTDRMHITNEAKRQAALAARQQKGNIQDQQTAQAIAQGVVPFSETPEGEKLAATRKMELDVAEAKRKSEVPKYVNFKLPDGSIKTVDVNSEKPPENGVIVGNAPLPMSDYQKAMEQYRESQLAYRQAQLDFQKDPNNPQVKANLLRRQSDLMRAEAYMMNAQGRNLGSINGKPVPGALLTPEGETVGSAFATQFRNSQQAMSMLNDAKGAFDIVQSTLQKLYASGGSLNSPAVATALATPQWTAEQVAQGIVAKSLNPAERDAVVAIKSARENIQGMRKAAGGGLSNEQVNRLEAQLPGPDTPNWAYAQSQLQLLNLTLQRLAEGVPRSVGGYEFHEKQMLPKKEEQKTSTGARIHVRLEDGSTGTIDETDFDPKTMKKIP